MYNVGKFSAIPRFYTIHLCDSHCAFSAHVVCVRGPGTQGLRGGCLEWGSCCQPARSAATWRQEHFVTAKINTAAPRTNDTNFSQTTNTFILILTAQDKRPHSLCFLLRFLTFFAIIHLISQILRVCRGSPYFIIFFLFSSFLPPLSHLPSVFRLHHHGFDKGGVSLPADSCEGSSHRPSTRFAGSIQGAESPEIILE